MRASHLREIAEMNGQAERISRAVLEWRIEGKTGAACLRLEIGEDDLTIPLVDAVPGHWEGESADFGSALRITLRDGEVIYARTDVLSGMLGLPGGVYDGPLG